MILIYLLIALKLAQVFKISPKKIITNNRKVSKSLGKFGKEFVRVENRMIKRVCSIMEKNVCQEVVKVDKNVIDLTEYKLKKAK